MSNPTRGPEVCPFLARLSQVAIVLSCLLLCSGATLQAQTLNVARTLGKGNTGALVAANALIVEDFSTLGFSFFQVAHGVTERVDLYVGVGGIGVFGEFQSSVTVGANVNLLTSRVVDISSYNLFTTPLNRRNEGASLLWFNSTIVSKEVKVGTASWSIYTGYNLTIPIDEARGEKLFTPPDTQHNVPFGVLIPAGRFGIFVEYDWGPETQIVGVGLAF